MDGPFFMDTRRLYTPPVVYRSVMYCPAAYPLPARTRRSRTLFRLTPRTFHPLFPMYNVKWTSRGLKRPSNVVESGFRGFGTRVWDGEIGSCYPVMPVRNSQTGQEQALRILVCMCRAVVIFISLLLTGGGAQCRRVVTGGRTPGFHSLPEGVSPPPPPAGRHTSIYVSRCQRSRR